MWAHSDGLIKGSTFTFTINAGIVPTKSVEIIERISDRNEKQGPVPDEGEAKDSTTKSRSKAVSKDGDDDDDDYDFLFGKKKKGTLCSLMLRLPSSLYRKMPAMSNLRIQPVSIVVLL